MSEIQNNGREQGMEKYFFRTSAEDFKKIPMCPIAYWAREVLIYSTAALKRAAAC